MPDLRSRDDRYDVCLIVAREDKELLQHVSLQYCDPLKHAYPPSELALLPGEYLTNLSGQRDSRRIYSLSFETSLGRTLRVGNAHWMGQLIWFTAPTGHELRSLRFMTDRLNSIINVCPHYVPRKRVTTDYVASWGKAITKIKAKAAKQDELPQGERQPFLALLSETIDRLVALDDREVVSAAALAASFDELVNDALENVFSHANVVVRALTLRPGVFQRLANLKKLSKALRILSTYLKFRFEAAELQFLTVASVSDGTDVVPFVFRFVKQPITSVNCDAAVEISTRHARTISQFRLDYVSRLIYFFLCEGDLTRLQAVVTVQATHHGQTKAQVFQTWEQCVPAIRLAIKHRRVQVLKWLLFDVRLFPEDRVPTVQLDAHSEDRDSTIDQLLTAREHEGNKDSEALKECHEFVTRVRKARAFQRLAQELVNGRGIEEHGIVPKVESLVPLITHACDLKWLFTFVELYRIPPLQTQLLFTKAFHHVLDQNLVLGQPSAIFFNRAFKEAKRQGYLTRNASDVLDVCFHRAHVAGAEWALKLQQQVRQTVYELDSTTARISALQHTLQHLRERMAQRELTQQERQCRKQLLSVVASLLPMVSPAFSIMEQCLSLCNPLAIVFTIVEHNGDSSDLEMDQFLAEDGLRLQHGLAEALGDIHIDADDLVEVLRDAVRTDARDDDDEAQRDSDTDAERARRDSANRRLRFQDAVTLYMEQRRDLEQAVQTSFRKRHESEASFNCEPALAVESAAVEPTWKWYNMLASVRGFFTSP